MKNYLQEVHGLCPYCNETISVLFDLSTGDQQYIEDCEVCCRPMTVSINWIDEDNFQFSFSQENEVS